MIQMEATVAYFNLLSRQVLCGGGGGLRESFGSSDSVGEEQKQAGIFKM